VTLKEVVERVNEAHERQDWRELLKWEGRMEELMEHQTDVGCNAILVVFSDAHRGAFNATESKDNTLSIVRLETRRADLAGKMQRFRDQGETLCRVSDQLLILGRRQEAEKYLQRARKIAEAHGFFSVECDACLGLGKLARREGREEEGVELMRNALVCVPLFEEEHPIMELNVLQAFTDLLFRTDAIDEVEPLIPRYLEAAKVESHKQERLIFAEFHSLYTSARLHEVLCTCTPRVGSPLHCSALACHQGR
jgi:hypothetical protein